MTKEQLFQDIKTLMECRATLLGLDYMLDDKLKTIKGEGNEIKLAENDRFTAAVNLLFNQLGRLTFNEMIKEVINDNRQSSK